MATAGTASAASATCSTAVRRIALPRSSGRGDLRSLIARRVRVELVVAMADGPDDIIGRDADLARLRGLLAGPARLVTIVGAAGVGKKRAGGRAGAAGGGD